MIHLITGGSGSGKSVYAENWLIRQGGREACGKEKPFLYIATMRPFGQESRQKIMRHRNQRAGKGFATLECYQDLEALEIDPEQDYCTLITCTPYGINTHRLLIRGHRIEVSQEEAAEERKNET